jgi:hypothetical protein
VIIIRYADNFQNLLIGAGLTYRDSTGNPASGAGSRVMPSYTTAGFKVYEFTAGTGDVEF